MRNPFRRPQRDQCSICGKAPVVMSGTCRDVYGRNVHLGACDEHTRRIDYALYLLGTGPDGDTLRRWLDERIGQTRQPAPPS